MKQRGFIFCMCLIVLCSVSCNSQVTSKNDNSVVFHVSLDGEDTNPGSETKPFRTLQHAQQVLKLNQLKGKKMITVYLHEGVYAFDESLIFTDVDSGTKDSPIVFTAYQDQTVKFIGGKELPKKWFGSIKNPVILERIISPKARKAVLSVNLHEHGIKEYGQL